MSNRATATADQLPACFVVFDSGRRPRKFTRLKADDWEERIWLSGPDGGWYWHDSIGDSCALRQYRDPSVEVFVSTEDANP